MRKKMFGKKLSLKKETVANLELTDMNEVKGGFINPNFTVVNDPFGTISGCETRLQTWCDGTSYVFAC